jgi:hypothetical protein
MDSLWVFPAAAGLMLLVGLWFLTSGVRRSRDWTRFVRVAREAEAEVVDVRRHVVGGAASDRRSVVWVPVVRFATPEGQLVEAETMYSGTTPSSLTVGGRVVVRYDPARPTRVALRSAANGRSFGCLQVGLGLGLVLVGSVALVGTIALVRALP